MSEEPINKSFPDLPTYYPPPRYDENPLETIDAKLDFLTGRVASLQRQIEKLSWSLTVAFIVICWRLWK